ncbi:antitoxin Xre/MbcA/ParS toxin-binding domain-containing protein [Paraburkholderia guartelaensis]|uniref:antitoxin Xre/MbcA/ParS toxin-binding domain-containing protein n=1 Tax=Paraburkholderia guartelaensis TaxID=2546446 RepID=UPI002AB6677A|nr:antitoxin Xre/MbcA/ParS toxin-binding domain-containing protein [Paraburkholderia guartelaensis]
MAKSKPPEREAPWQYRVMEFGEGDETWRDIREVYYRDGRPECYAVETASPYWFADEGDEAAMHVLDRMREALGRPVLRPRDFVERETPAAQSTSVVRGAAMIDQATGVFGCQERAEGWLETPAYGLDGRRPVDLLRSAEGTKIIHDFLTRLDHGTYT